MSNIIDNKNDSRYDDTEVNETEVIINDKNILEGTSQTHKQPYQGGRTKMY